MKFSFGHEEYRKELANELKKQRDAGNFDVAIKKLEEERITDDYKISKITHRNSDNDIESVESSGPFYKEMESRGFDIVDISSDIPKEIDLLIDKYRLNSIGKELPNLNKDSHFEECNNFVNKITDGKYFDNRNPNHVIGGYSDFLNGLFLHTQSDRRRHEYITGELHRAEKLWINFGRTNWLDPTKQLAIFSTNNPNFRRFLTLIIMLDDNNDGLGLYDKIYKEGRDISTIKQLEEITPKDFLAKVYEKIDSLQTIINGDRYYEISPDIGDREAREHMRILPWMILKNLPIRIKNNQTTQGASLEIESFFRNFKDREAGVHFFDLHPYTKNKLSFAAIADTIVDLPDKKVYKYNQEK